MANRIVFTDEGLNRYGYRVLNSGIQLATFKTNALLFWGHNVHGLPLGKWEDVKLEDGKISAIPKIDKGDALGVEVQRKLDGEFINAASMGIRILETSAEPHLMLEGQTRPTVTKCELMEVSLVGIPANANAVRLYNDAGEVLNLSSNESIDLLKLDGVLPSIKQKESKMKGLLTVLGVPESGTESDAIAIVSELQAKVKKAENLQTELDALKVQAKKDKVEALVDGALAAKKITVSQKEKWVNLGLADYESAKVVLDGMTGYVSPTALLGGGVNGGGEDLSDAQRYDQMGEKGELLAYKKTNPADFKRLQAAKLKSLK